MTAYLQPGDAIHLAIPTMPDEKREQLCNAYAVQGVNAFIVTTNVTTLCPVVVAVFRKPPPEDAA